MKSIKTPRRTYKKKSYKKYKPSKRFIKNVQSIIKKDVETKNISYNYSMTSFNSGVNSSGDVLRVLPSITIGTTNGARIGDQVKGQTLNIKGHFLINTIPISTGSGVIPTGIPANSRLMIRAFVFTVKRFQNYDDAVSNVSSWSSQFLQNGSATQALDGTLQSMYLPVNKEVITVHKEIKKYITIESLNTITFGSPANQIAMTNVGYKDSVKFFNINVKCKRLMKYDSASFSPQNYAPLFCISYAHLDGSSPDVLQTTINATYVSTFKYEDA